MKRYIIFIIFISLLLSLGLIQANEQYAPYGFAPFCEANIHILCQNTSLVYEDNKSLDTIKKINREVNKSIKYVPDETTKIDDWVIPNTHGDCEDFILLKSKLLYENGYTANELKIGLLSYKGTFHAVLLVKQDSNWYVLDFDSNEIKKYSSIYKSGMKWFAYQIEGTLEFNNQPF